MKQTNPLKVVEISRVVDVVGVITTVLVGQQHWNWLHVDPRTNVPGHGGNWLVVDVAGNTLEIVLVGIVVIVPVDVIVIVLFDMIETELFNTIVDVVVSIDLDVCMNVVETNRNAMKIN